MEEEKQSQPLKNTCVSISLSTSDSSEPVTKDLNISYIERGKIVSPADQRALTLSNGAYRAEVVLDEQTDVQLTGEPYTPQWKLSDIIKVSAKIFVNNERKVGLTTKCTVGEKPLSLGSYQNYPVQGPVEFAKLIVVAKPQENIDKK
jgi:hypothetical protein